MSSEGLSHVRRFTVHPDVVHSTVATLRGRGRLGVEAFIVWGGVVDPTSQTMTFRSAYYPRQDALVSPWGLSVRVEGEALFELNREAFARQEILGAQVHTHPSEAFHSALDDAYPLVTLVGSLSGVIPHFGEYAEAGDIRTWEWYRLEGTGVWTAADLSVMEE